MEYTKIYSKNKPIEFKTIVEIVRGTRYDNEALIFVFADMSAIMFYHEQDCCERVAIDDIEGDLQDLIGTPLLQAEVASQRDEAAFESGTWTFYKFATIKGYVTVRWYGSSNGYYSESVNQITLNWNEQREDFIGEKYEVFNHNQQESKL